MVSAISNITRTTARLSGCLRIIRWVSTPAMAKMTRVMTSGSPMAAKIAARGSVISPLLRSSAGCDSDRACCGPAPSPAAGLAYRCARAALSARPHGGDSEAALARRQAIARPPPNGTPPHQAR